MARGCVPLRLYLQKQVASPRAVVCSLLPWSRAERVTSEPQSRLSSRNSISAGACLLCPLAPHFGVNRPDEEDKVRR